MKQFTTTFVSIIIMLVASTFIHAQSWSLTGNSGTNPNINFVGTTDANALAFRVNNQRAGFLSDDSTVAKTFFGFQALLSSTGIDNSAFGYRALKANTTGHDNVGVGAFALLRNTTGNYNTGFGSSALRSNITGSDNTAIGQSSLLGSTTGNRNTAIGGNAMTFCTTGNNNTAVGFQVLGYVGAGSFNTSVGAYSLSNNKGNSNTANGYNSLALNTTGTSNSAMGYQSLYSTTTGSYNTAVGYNALQVNTTHSKNTAIGYAAGNNFTSSASTYVGHGATPTVSGIENSTAIGFQARVTASNQVRIGNTTVTSIGGQVGWSTLSDGRFKKNIKEDVPGLDFINKLKPVTYNIEVRKLEHFLGKNDDELNEYEAAYSAAETKLHTGFVAQEVEKAAQAIHYDFDGVNAPKNKTDNYSLVYADFIPSIVKAVQELSKQNEDLQKQVNELKTAMAASSTSKSISPAILSNATLDQNIPNPFITNTVINYYIPLSSNRALLSISNSIGQVIKVINLANKGKGTTNISRNDLSAGTYYYTLMIDGKRTSTKQMLVAK